VCGGAAAPVFSGASRLECLGGAANAAANLAALGGKVSLLGVVGADALGRRTREMLREAGIAGTFVLEDLTRVTAQRTYLSAAGRPLLRLDRESQRPLSTSMIARLAECIEALLPRVDGILCIDGGQGVCAPSLIDPLLAHAHVCSCPVFVDCASQASARYRPVTALVAHLDPPARAEERQDAARALLERSRAQALLLDDGREGLSLFLAPHVRTKPGAPLHFSVPAGPTEGVDRSWNGDGSGRAAAAALCAGSLYGLSMVEAARLAVSAAEVAARRPGTAIVSWAELSDRSIPGLIG
jgi:D-beta-D-heptose 7-phosphate kinase/D-beta-D-heptose 1-phosphate adenosyltransferase